MDRGADEEYSRKRVSRRTGSSDRRRRVGRESTERELKLNGHFTAECISPIYFGNDRFQERGEMLEMDVQSCTTRNIAAVF